MVLSCCKLGLTFGAKKLVSSDDPEGTKALHQDIFSIKNNLHEK